MRCGNSSQPYAKEGAGLGASDMSFRKTGAVARLDLMGSGFLTPAIGDDKKYISVKWILWSNSKGWLYTDLNLATSQYLLPY